MSLQQDSFALKGNICYSINPREVYCGENCYVVCAEGRSAGVFRELPEQFSKLHVYDCGDCVIIPGLTSWLNRSLAPPDMPPVAVEPILLNVDF